MLKDVHSVLILTKAGSKPAEMLARDIVAWLGERSVACSVLGNGEGLAELAGTFATQPDARPDLCLVLGGDGTMLGAARAAAKRGVPLLGINHGRVGFLAELDRTDWPEGLGRVLAGQADVTERLALDYRVTRPGDTPGTSETLHRGVAVNDVVVNRGALARLVTLSVRAGLNGKDGTDGNALEPMGVIRADGLIVASPTGSTGYAVSAGGPLTHPGLDVLVLTPVCPFLNSFRPMVLPGDAVAQIRVLDPGCETHLTIDGQMHIPLRGDECVTIRRAARGPRFVLLDPDSYFRKLTAKGFTRDPSAAVADDTPGALATDTAGGLSTETSGGPGDDTPAAGTP